MSPDVALMPMTRPASVVSPGAPSSALNGQPPVVLWVMRIGETSGLISLVAGWFVPHPIVVFQSADVSVTQVRVTNPAAWSAATTDAVADVRFPNARFRKTRLPDLAAGVVVEPSAATNASRPDGAESA